VVPPPQTHLLKPDQAYGPSGNPSKAIGKMSNSHLHKLFIRESYKETVAKQGTRQSRTELQVPRQCVTIDQLVSTTPGLIAQLRGKPTKHRYQAATVFVDHESRLAYYVHLQTSTSAKETDAGKLAFEQFAKSNGVSSIKHYHADNGIFADNLFRRAVSKGGQTLIFCGVNVHWQIGVAKGRICKLEEHARTILINSF
jgi:hypothetical protein